MGFRRTKFLDQLYVITDRAPTVTDDSTTGMDVGVRWINETAQDEYLCTNSSVGTAVWILSASSSSGGFLTKAAADTYYRPKPSYAHTQGVPSALWTINHNLGSKPAVTVVDSALTQVEGDVNYVDMNTLTLGFAYSFSGTAYLA